MPIRKSIFRRVKTFIFGTKASNETYPDLESSPCQKCKIMMNYMKLTEKALRLNPVSVEKPHAVPIQEDIYTKGGFLPNR